MIDLDTALRLVGMRLGDRALIGPEVVQLDLTDACNNNCIGCWARSPFLRDGDHYDTLDKGALDLPFVRQLFPTLRELRVRELFLGGGGEPLCHPDLLAVIREAKKFGLRVTLNTNFTLADEAFCEAIADLGLDQLIVSVWAGTAATYARIHPNKTEAAFHRLTSLLKYLTAQRAARDRLTPKIKLYEVINSLNFQEIPLMLEHARETGADEVELAVFDPIPRRTHIFTLDRRAIDRTIQIVESLPAEEPPVVHKELFLRRLRNIDAPKGVFDNGIAASIPCAAGWFFSRITTVGQLHACLKAHRVAVGDLKQHDLRAAWFGEGMRVFRRHTLKLDYEDPWLQNIGHDINFVLPGCFRICDNLGFNQHIMRLVGGLEANELAALDAMEQAARDGASLDAIEREYLRHLPDAQRPEPISQPVVAIARETGLTLDADMDLVHETSGAQTPWLQTLQDLYALGDADTIRLPVSVNNIARLDRILELIRESTGRPVEPERARLIPKPLADLHVRWPAQLRELRVRLAHHRIDLDLSDQRPYQALWKIASASRPDRDAELLRALGALTGVPLIGPHTFHLDVTNACPAECIYCWFHSPLSAARTDPHRLTEANSRTMMEWQDFIALANDLAQLEAKEDVVLSGKGDPLAHPRFADMLRELKKRDLHVTLFTGGHLLNEAIIRTILEAELDMFYVSLSAAGEETYLRLHEQSAPGAFHRIVDNVRKLVELRRASGQTTPRVVLVDVITNRNDHEVEDFARLAVSLGVDHLRYQMASIEDYNSSLALPETRLNGVAEQLRQARQIAEAGGVALVENIEFQVAGYGEGRDWSGDRYRRVGCLAGFVFSRVWADGTISFCCAPRPIGNIRDRRFAEWWTGPAYDRARLAARSLGRHADFQFADGTPLWTEVCRRCPNYEGIERLRQVLELTGLLDYLP